MNQQTRTFEPGDQVSFCEPEFYALSNFSSFSLYWKQYLFPTLQHVYMWESFYECNNLLSKAAAAEIRIARSPYIATELAEKWKERQIPNWEEVEESVLQKLLWSKVHQHEYVMRKLRETGDREIIGDSPLTSKLWMKIREIIKEKTTAIN